MTPTNFVFWQNHPSHHQSPWLAALAERTVGDVYVLHEWDLSESRRRMGWKLPDYGRARVDVGITPAKAALVMKSAGSGAVHIFSGMGAYPEIHRVFSSVGAGARSGIMTESPRRNGLRAYGSIAKGLYYRVRHSKRVQFVLGLGEHASEWYRRVGYDPARLYEFAYYPTIPAELSVERTSPDGNGPQILFIGTLDPNKGVDRLITALEPLVGLAWRLNLVGSGPSEAILRALAASKLPDRVHFHGALDHAEAMKVLASADVLVLPSHHDGYGAVVGEALLSGVPAICSSECGARQALSSNRDAGYVFTTESELRHALGDVLRSGQRSADQVEKLRKWARSVLSPESGAEYFLQIMQHVYGPGPRPVPPWRQPQVQAQVQV
jgi:glycosyltransferase involved in cell wall biosynthesis